MKAVLDRIVDGSHGVMLVGEKEKEYLVPFQKLPKDSKEGMWYRVSIENNEVVVLYFDEEETKNVKERIEDKMASLKARKGSKFKR